MTRVGTEEQERGIVADINSFTSSPRSGAIPLQSPTSPPVHRMHFAVDVQNAPNGNIRRRPGSLITPCILATFSCCEILQAFPYLVGVQSLSRPRWSTCQMVSSFSGSAGRIGAWWVSWAPQSGETCGPTLFSFRVPQAVYAVACRATACSEREAEMAERRSQRSGYWA